VPRVAFVLVPQVHLLDLAGPAQAFWTAADLGYGYEQTYVSESPTVLTAQGVPVTAATSWPSLTSDDLVVVPGWHAASRPQPSVSPEHLQCIVDHHAGGGTVASVCAGAFALGSAGLLDGRRCTTHQRPPGRAGPALPTGHRLAGRPLHDR
jgi:transcriptional regulator GlxA family with amidase domain